MRSFTGNRRRAFIFGALLVIAILLVYGRVVNFDFVNYDDHRYITRNPLVQQGLTWNNIAWAFSTFEVANWHPLTWLSHMLDCDLFAQADGWQWPGGHHLMNVLFHLANTLILFSLLRRMMRSLWPSALVAALFALHPLHVESVAWVSERKDLLSTCFGLLALWAYVRYVEKPILLRYLLIILCFALSLLSKPMLVTLPLLLLLLDFWPLRRIAIEHSESRHPRTIPQLVLEKLPLLALSAASCVMTILAQSHGQAISSVEQVSLFARVENALVGYLVYIVQTIWPVRLSPLYPLPASRPIWQVAAVAVVMALITIFAASRSRKRPHLIVGWLWFIGTLVPVIGLVQVGSQAHADRYTYVPLIGLFIMVAWSLPEPDRAKPVPMRLSAISSIAILFVLSALAWKQVGYWRDSVTLSMRAITVTDPNAVAHFNLANALVEHGDLDGAVEHFQAASTIMPEWADTHFNLGNTLARQNKLDQAIAEYQAALKHRPRFVDAMIGLGIALARRGDFDQAINELSSAQAIDPGNASVHVNLGNVLARAGRLDEAIAHYHRAVALDSHDADTYFYLGNALARRNSLDEAMTQFAEALRLDPGNIRAHMSFSTALASKGRWDEALLHLAQASELARGSGQSELDAEIRARIQEYQAAQLQSPPH